MLDWNSALHLSRSAYRTNKTKNRSLPTYGLKNSKKISIDFSILVLSWTVTNGQCSILIIGHILHVHPQAPKNNDQAN